MAARTPCIRPGSVVTVLAMGLGLACIGSACPIGEGGSCTTDSDCPAGKLCVSGTCEASPHVSGTYCSTDDDCPAGKVCGGDQTCVPRVEGAACISSAECPDDAYCLPTTMACGPLAAGACKRAEQCPTSSPRCSAPANGVGRCLQCLASEDCPETGATCTVQGVCVGGSATSGSSSGSVSSSSGPVPSSSGPVSSSSQASSGSSGGTVDLGGWVVRDQESNHFSVIPGGTRVPRGGLLLMARDATRDQFQAEWNVVLGGDVVFLNSQAGNTGVPVVNGDETWVLADDDGVVVDGPTIRGESGNCYVRLRAEDAGRESAWDVLIDSDASPGRTQLSAQDRGVFISTWSDASGTGRYIYEYIEIFVNP